MQAQILYIQIMQNRVLEWDFDTLLQYEYIIQGATLNYPDTMLTSHGVL